MKLLTAGLVLGGWCLLLGSSAAQTQTPPRVTPATPRTPSAPAGITNANVIKMVAAGLSEQNIVEAIQQATKRSFDLSPDGLIQLKTSGVPESIISVMLNPAAARIASTPPVSPNGPTSPPAPKPVEAGASTRPRKTVKTPDGEKVPLILMEDLSSATAQQGDHVSFSVAEDVKVGDALIIAKGSTGVGSVTLAKKKGMLGQGGKLAISIDQVKGVDGQNIRVRATAGREGDAKIGKTVAVAILAGPFAFMVKGKDITVSKGAAFSAYIDETKEIAAIK